MVNCEFNVTLKWHKQFGWSSPFFFYHLKDNYHSFFNRIAEQNCLYLELRTLLNPY